MNADQIKRDYKLLTPSDLIRVHPRKSAANSLPNLTTLIRRSDHRIAHVAVKRFCKLRHV